MTKNYDDYSVSEDSSCSNSEYYQQDNNDYCSSEKYPIYISILKDLKIKIIGKPEETLSIEKERRKQSLFSKNNVIEYKFLVIGDNLSGKTSFCEKFAKNKFNLEIKPSTEINCYLKSLVLFDKEIKIYLIDVNENLLNNNKNLNNFFYSNIKGVFAIYDVTKIKSFEKTLKITENYREKLGNVIPFILIGNKNDLKNLKEVNFEEVKNKSKKLKCDLKEGNCIDENSVKDIIKYFIANIFYNDLDDLDKDKIKNDILIKENNTKKKNLNL